MPLPVLLLGAGSATYSEFTLAEIAIAYPVVLADTTAPLWARPYLARHLPIDLADAATIEVAAKNYATGHEIRGVLTYLHEHVVAAERTARRLSLPCAAVKDLALLADRVAIRRRLAQCDVPVIRWSEVDSSESATAQADSLGYPVVFRAQIARGNSLCASDRNGVLDCYQRLAKHTKQERGNQRGNDLLIEECLPGRHIGVETVVLGSGDIRIAAVTRTTLGPPPRQQPIRHCVYAHDALMHDPVVRRLVERVVQSLSISRGVLHIEMKMTSRGPLLVEVSAQTPGDLIPLLVKRATGVNLPQVAAALATGVKPDLTPVRQRTAAAHYAYSNLADRIEQLATNHPSNQPLKGVAQGHVQAGQSV